MPRTAAQNEAIRDKRKDKIMNKTLKLFAIKGFDSITIDDISKASNSAHGLFYHYFDVKEDLYNAIVTLYETKYASKLLNYDEIEKMPAYDALKAIIEFYHNVLSESELLICYSRLNLNRFYQTRTATKALSGTDLFTLLPKLIAKGQEEGSVRKGNPNDIAKIMISVFLTETELKLVMKDDFHPMDPSVLISQLHA